MSVLIFEPSARGYVDAEQLHKFFVENGVDRNAWISRRRELYHHGGKRLLYGYLATKEDLDVFNQHSQGLSFLSVSVSGSMYCLFLLYGFLLFLAPIILAANHLIYYAKSENMLLPN